MCPPVVFAPFALGQHGVRDSQKDGQHCGWNGGVDHVHLASFTGWESRFRGAAAAVSPAPVSARTIAA